MFQEASHFYGPQVHLLSSPLAAGLLAQLCSPQTFQPQIDLLTEQLYEYLVAQVIECEFTQTEFTVATRMTASHPEILLQGQKIDPDQQAVCVNIARAGTWPSQVCYQYLHRFLPPQNLRQDHIFASRLTSSSGQVTGTSFAGSKIGGPVKDRVVLVPDPMGATGNTLISVVKHYRNLAASSAQENSKASLDTPEERPRKIIALHLIVTPEYLRKVQDEAPELIVYALRVDRGLSESHILQSPLGKFWAQEKGLNSLQYIVPGGGGFGEIMNNSFV